MQNIPDSAVRRTLTFRQQEGDPRTKQIQEGRSGLADHHLIQMKRIHDVRTQVCGTD